MPDGSFLFWTHMEKELKAKKVDAAVAILNYGLVPEYPYPTQLRQAVLSLRFLLSQGISPSNIILAGESAGGNLILGLLSHILHPIANLPAPPKLSTPLCGAYLGSPWVSLTGDTGSHEKFSSRDVCSRETLATLGKTFLEGISQNQLPYVTFSPQASAKLGLASATTEGWWKDVSGVCSKFFVTAGDIECLRDDAVEFAELLENQARPAPVRLIVQRNGVHLDPALDFTLGDGEKNALTPIVSEWLADCYRGIK
jgi:acetyl esterase/lipase